MFDLSDAPSSLQAAVEHELAQGCWPAYIMCPHGGSSARTDVHYFLGCFYVGRSVSQTGQAAQINPKVPIPPTLKMAQGNWDAA